VYNIPTITGRLFDGNNFAPISGVKMELYYNGALIAMKDLNWHNPLHLVSNTEGTYSFWPVPVLAKKVGEHTAFEYTLKAEMEAHGEEYEPLTHVFKIPVISEIQTANSFSLERTFKLPDLFMFPPGEDELNRSLDE
jgi:competence protein ComFB